MKGTVGVQPSPTTTIWVFIVDTDHGTNVSVHPTREEADAANYDYCDEWWHREYPDVPRPDDDRLVAEYWQRQNAGGEEWHLITECTLSGVRLVPDGKDAA